MLHYFLMMHKEVELRLHNTYSNVGGKILKWGGGGRRLSYGYISIHKMQESLTLRTWLYNPNNPAFKTAHSENNRQGKSADSWFTMIICGCYCTSQSGLLTDVNIKSYMLKEKLFKKAEIHPRRV